MNILTYLKDSFHPPRVHLPVTETEQRALTNLISVCKERIWLNSNYPKRPEPSFDYSEDLTQADIDNINKSIEIVGHLLRKHARYFENDENRNTKVS